MRSSKAYARLAAAFLLLAATGVDLAQAGHTLLGKVLLPNGSTPDRTLKVTLTRVYEVTIEGDNQSYETTTVRVEVFTLSAAPADYTENIQLRGKDLEVVSRHAPSTVDEGDGLVPAKARKEFQEGEKSAAENKSEWAIAHFREAISVYPSFYSALVALGDQYEKQGRHDDAIASYKAAVELKPDRVRAVAALGAAMTRRKKYSEAIPWLRRSVELDNQGSVSYLYLGLAELNTGNLTDSERDLRRAYAIGKQPVAHIYLASLYEHKGDLAGALGELELFIKEAPDSPQAPEIRSDIDKIQKRLAQKR